jgi:hypothetical protein
VTSYEYPYLIGWRSVDRTSDEIHASLLQPISGCGDQRLGYLLIIDGLKEAKEARPIAELPIVLVIDNGGDGADHLSIPAGQEKLSLGVLPERIALGVQPFPYLADDGWHPIGVMGVDTPGEANKALEVLWGGNRLHLYVGLRFGHEFAPNSVIRESVIRKSVVRESGHLKS